MENKTGKMKLLGLIGGLSFASTLVYYRLINEQIGQRLGGLHSSKIILHSLDLETFAQYAHKSDFKRLSWFVANAVKVLYQAGAEILVICSNTAHIAFPVIQKKFADLPILHIADALACAIKNAQIGTAGFLGTVFTMKERFLFDRLEMHGISVIVPDKAEEITEIQRVINDELSHNKVVPASREVFLRNVDTMRKRGAQGIILGCTEIQMILNQNHVPDFPIFDSTILHVNAAVDVQLGKNIEDFFPEQ